jgi:hypothetical protein
VWFYAPSAHLVQLVLAHVADLAFRKRLRVAWTVSLCEHQPDPRTTTFNLKSNVAPTGPENLRDQQADLEEIARGLGAALRRGASEQLSKLRSIRSAGCQ